MPRSADEQRTQELATHAQILISYGKRIEELEAQMLQLVEHAKQLQVPNDDS